MKKSKARTSLLARMAIMVAVTVLMSLIPTIPLLPSVNFIKYELSDLPILISVFAFGTPAGFAVAALSILINFLFGGAESGPYGMIMHMIAIGAYLIPAGLIYHTKKTRKSAIIGMLVGVLVSTAAMIPANLIITPAFMGVPVAVVKPLLATAIIPVNLMKGVITAVLTFVLYKHVSRILYKDFKADRSATNQQNT